MDALMALEQKGSVRGAWCLENSLFLRGVGSRARIPCVSEDFNQFQPCMSTLGSESSCTEEMFPDKNDSLAEPGLRPWLFWIKHHLSCLQQPVCSREATRDRWPLFINTWASLPGSSFHMLKLLTWHPNINGKCLFNTESYSILALMSKP